MTLNILLLDRLSEAAESSSVYIACNIANIVNIAYNVHSITQGECNKCLKILPLIMCWVKPVVICNILDSPLAHKS